MYSFSLFIKWDYECKKEKWKKKHVKRNKINIKWNKFKRERNEMLKNEIEMKPKWNRGWNKCVECGKVVGCRGVAKMELAEGGRWTNAKRTNESKVIKNN